MGKWMQVVLASVLLILPSTIIARDANRGDPRGIYRMPIPSAPLSVRHVVLKNGLTPARQTGLKRVQLSTGDGTEIYGVVVAELDDTADVFSTNGNWGWYRFNAKDPVTLQNVMKNSAFANFAGGAVYDGHLHFTNYFAPYEGYCNVTLYDFDLSNPGAEPAYQSVYGSLEMMAGDLAYRKSDGKVYGYFWDGSVSDDSVYTFGTIDYNTGVVTKIADEDIYFIGLTFDNHDRLWALDSNGNLWNIDPANGNIIGEAHALSFVQKPAMFFQSMTCDPRTGKLYYAGIDVDHQAALYQIDLDSNYTLTRVASIPDNAEVVCLYIPEVTTDDAAPEGVRDLRLSFPTGTTTGTATFTMPAKTFGGTDMNNELSWTVFVDDSPTVSGTAHSGETVTTPLSVTNGRHSFTVQTANGELKSPISEKQTFWVGADKPKAPAHAAVSVDGNTVNVHWAAVKEGVNGGFVDSAAVTYTLTRYPDSVVVKGITDTTYTATLPDVHVTDFHYTVQAVYNGQESEPTSSNHVQAGSAFTVPYTESFDSDDDFNLFTVIDNGGQGTWAMSWYCVRIFHFSGQSDDWLITPPIKMHPGRQYEVSCTSSPGYASNPDSLQILIGQTTNPSDFRVVAPTVCVKDEDQLVNGTFSVSDDGEYRLAFRSLGGDDSYGIILDNIKVIEKTSLSAPDSVTDLAVTAAAQGRLSANIKFTAPTKDIKGADLSELDHINVYRDDTVLVKTVNAAPGEQVTVTDDSPVNGINTYKVIAYNAGEGVAATASAYVGVDVPGAPQNVRLTDNINGTMTLSWSAPAKEGVNGHYVDASALTYKVYDYYGNCLDSLMTSCSKTFRLSQTGEQNVNYYMVSAVSVAGEGSAARSNAVYGGTADVLPITDSFQGGKYHYAHWGSEDSGLYNYFSQLGDITADNDWGSMTWTAYDEGEQAWFRTGKISLKGNNHPAVFFQYYKEPGKDIKLEVYADLASKGKDVMFTQDFKDLHGEKGWQKVALYFSDDAKDAPYVILNFHYTAGETKVPVYLDDIDIREVYDADLASTMITPGAAVKCKPVEMNVTVSNRGRNAATDFYVNLYADGEKVDSVKGGVLAANADSTYVLHYTPSMDAPSEVKVSADAQFSTLTDGAPSDNATSETVLQIEEPQLPTVEDLSADHDASGNVALTWNAPTTLDNVKKEDFESATPWIMDNINGFTTFDGDKLPNNSWTLMTYPHMGERFAWILMNGDDMTMDSSQKGFGMGHNSLQAMHAVSNVHDYTAYDSESDDWLISPELSGKAQTIEFWGNSEGPSPEDFYIYASSENPDTASLRKNRIHFEKFAPCGWKKYSYDLPEGTKYFAIVFTSNLTGFAVDDVTYEGPALTLTGYNVYRDGSLLAALPAATTTWNEASNDGADHVYSVSAVYREGESSICEVSIASAIMQISGKLASVKSLKGAIEISSEAAQPVSIFTNSGQLVFSGVVSGQKLVSVQQGLYIVKMGKQSTQLSVK